MSNRSKNQLSTTIFVSKELADLWGKYEGQLSLIKSHLLTQNVENGLENWYKTQTINAGLFQQEVKKVADQFAKEAPQTLLASETSITKSLQKQIDLLSDDKKRRYRIPKRKVATTIERLNDFQKRQVSATIKQAHVGYLQTAEQIHQLGKYVLSSKEVFAPTQARLLKSQRLIDLVQKYALESAFKGQTVRYANGRNVSVKSYMEMCIRTEISNMAKDISEEAYQKLGIDLYLISEHANCAEDHTDIQGKVCTTNPSKYNGKYLDKVKVDELLERPNCGHYLTPITAKQADNLNETKKSLGTIKDGGKTGDYEAKQRQRYNERAIRHYKTERDNLFAMAEGTKDLNLKRQLLDKAKQADSYVKKWQAEQRRHLEQNPTLVREYKRENSSNLNYEMGVLGKKKYFINIFAINEDTFKRIPNHEKYKNEFVVTEERKNHIRERHPEITDEIIEKCIERINNTKDVIVDKGNLNTFFFVSKEDERKSLIFVIKMANQNNNTKNSLITAYFKKNSRIKKQIDLQKNE